MEFHNPSISHPHFEKSISNQNTIKETVSRDLKEYLAQYKDQKIGLKVISNRMEIHPRTLSRLISKDNKPTYLTLYKIYRVLLEATNDTDLFNRCPQAVQQYLIKNNPKPLDQNITYALDLEAEISKCSLFAEIYFTATAGSISKEFILFRYGNLGEEILTKMLKAKILISNSAKDLFNIGNVQTNISAKTIKKVGLQFSERYSKPENSDDSGSNFSAFFIEGLSEETYNEWLKIDEEAFKKKVELTRHKQALGPIKAFTYIATDTNLPAKARGL